MSPPPLGLGNNQDFWSGDDSFSLFYGVQGRWFPGLLYHEHPTSERKQCGRNLLISLFCVNVQMKGQGALL